jgi:conjugal transfer pilus assembly protein TraU
MWEPARLIETVKDPWCFPSLDMDLGDSSGGGSSSSDAELRGGTESMGNQEVTRTFAQAHYWGFYAYQMMEEDINKSCWEDTGYKLLYMTEIDPLWNDDYTAALIMPEATLFTDKDIQLSCMVDSISSNLWLSSPILFWCMGSWGSAYPMTGHKRQKQETEKSEAKHAKRVNEINLHKNEIYFRPEHCGDEAENRCSLVHEVKDNDRDKGQGGPQPQRNTKHPGKGRGMDCLT